MCLTCRTQIFLYVSPSLPQTGLISRGQKSGQRRGSRAVGRRGEGRQLGNKRRAGSKRTILRELFRRKTGRAILPALVRRREDVV